MRPTAARATAASVPAAPTRSSHASPSRAWPRSAEVEPEAARELGGIPVPVELEQPQVGRAQVGVVRVEPVERGDEAGPLSGSRSRRGRAWKWAACRSAVAVASPDACRRCIAYCRTGSSSRNRGSSSGDGTRSTSDWSTSAPRAGRTSRSARRGRDGLDGVEGEPAAEDREPGEEVDLLGLEEVHAPVEHRGHRAVPVGQVARARAEAGLLQPGEQGRRGEQPQARGRELEGEGEPVEPAADRRQGGGVVLGDGGGEPGGRGPVEQQGDGGGGRPRSRACRRRRRQRAHSTSSCSARTRSGARLVATTTRSGQRATRSASTGAAPVSCSRLSSTRSTRRPRRWATRRVERVGADGLGQAERGGDPAGRRAPARAPGRGRRPGAAGEPGRLAGSTSIASRVLPTPPGPVMVTSRWVPGRGRQRVDRRRRGR